MTDYSTTLGSFEKILAIRQKKSPEKHSNQTITCTNIGDVHRLMDDYEMALSFHRKKLSIQENVKCNPSDCATTNKNLGETCRKMKDYSTASIYFQRGLEIREKKLPKYHLNLAAIFHNMEKIYSATREYRIAMKNVQQAVEIAQEKLPPNHPHLLEYKETYEKIRKKL
ncbi:unnamed protein product [Rotaria sp. Silwood2]|nr:unnamed protein product [Rotaria sp. Silwood2]CAF2533088.1 unnamed protein product [Rotaria sp. Silwood2]CAF2785509.1 unnamed protein product [Rotaria sp. Silwood2]CAF2930108.1 unnamed protein product [Rotaria sp. Silwood2]CAF3944778.1 unnamed protein product [Rotaria sp. Silwood2]